MLSDADFEFCLKRMPLVSIDICVVKDNRFVATVLRNKNPAKGYLFTPGGRIFKNESLIEAKCRILKNELGIILNQNKISFIGCLEHFYESSAYSESISTHYICLLYRYELNSDEQISFEYIDTSYVGHSELQWVDFTKCFDHLNLHYHAKQNIKHLINN